MINLTIHTSHVHLYDTSIKPSNTLPIVYYATAYDDPVMGTNNIITVN